MSRSRATVVELVGPAGAGKTTLAHRIGATQGSPRKRLSLWGLPTWALAASTAALMPAVVAAAGRRHPLRGPELAQMIRLDALRRVVSREAKRHGVLLLDEGPVFALSWLDVSFYRNGDRTLAAWRRRVTKAWADLLDGIVCLDASDATLAERIRTRAKAHPVKHKSDAEIYGFTVAFRQAFGKVIVDMASGAKMKVITLDTNDDSLEASAKRLLAMLDGKRNGH